jgi:phosphoglycolate phosphatase-like HAD superfamily hydrolase
MERLILFDIDGTLTRTENGYLPFNEAIASTFGVAGDIRTVTPDGNTDPMIVKEIFAKARIEIEPEEMPWSQFMARLQSCYRQHVELGTIRIRPLPGAPALLRALWAREQFCASVVTGNFEITAKVKLESAGLAAYLTRGAYGSDSEERPDLPAIAMRRYEETTGRAISPQQCIIVGDTPKDLQAARQNSMKCVLVGTGRYPVEELLYWQPDACLADLVDTEAVIALLSRI